MAFIRTGSCNCCGECCGYPKPDGTQNNPWSKNYPDSIKTWSRDSIREYLPVFTISGNMIDTPNGSVTLQGKKRRWIWVKNHGFCADLSPYGDQNSYDQRCPFLAPKAEDNTVRCLLYDTGYKYIWEQLCQPNPPVRFETQEEVDRFFANCPSCSYKYVAAKGE